MVHDAVAISAPGKVLLAGGYLVLDRAYNALVFGLDARIHVVCQDIPTEKGVVLNEILVQSPQFHDAVWEYGYRLAEKDGGIKVTQLRVDADLHLNRNPFIETTLEYALSYIASITGPNITPASVTILADNDYYSTPTDLPTGTSSTPPPRFHNFNVPLSRAHKTGLGSSAALVTALTASLLAYYLPPSAFDLTTSPSRRHLHNLAQTAHCAAQGKIGSGFDIASAVYGSCLYRRFSPDLLAAHPEPGAPHFAPRLRDLVRESGPPAAAPAAWDTEIRPDAVALPRGLRLVLCDVDCGSQTPGMVKQVLAWRAAHPADAERIWGELQRANEALAQELTALAREPPRGDGDGYERLRGCFGRIRKGIQAMTRASGVAIEPAAQTALLDACAGVAGVIGGVVPGAGGYDAIALVIEDAPGVVERLGVLLDGWRFGGESGGESGRVRMLGVREEMEGVRVGRVGEYAAWIS